MGTQYKGRDPSGPTEVLAFLQAGIVVFLIFIGFFYLIFATPAVANFIFTGTLILASLLIAGGIGLFKLLVDCLHRTCRVDELAEHRNNILIGLGGIAICSGAIKVISFFLMFDGLTFLFRSTLYFVTIACIFFFFNFDAVNRVTGKSGDTDEKWCKVVVICFFTHIVLLIAAIRIAVEYDDLDFRLVLSLCQIFCGIVFGVSTTEFILLLGFGIKFRRGYTPRPARQEETVKVTFKKERKPKLSNETKPVTSDSRPICNICSFHFSDGGSHIPRMLKECGHTICESCAGKLLKTNSILCPFCQQKTTVNGSVGSLPKNFGMLEMMAKVQEKIQGQRSPV